MSHGSSVSMVTRMREGRGFFRDRGKKFACDHTGSEIHGGYYLLGKVESFAAVKAAGTLSSIYCQS